LQKNIKRLALSYDLPFYTSPSNMNTDNAAMIAWMGWELINAN